MLYYNSFLKKKEGKNDDCFCSYFWFHASSVFLLCYFSFILIHLLLMRHEKSRLYYQEVSVSFYLNFLSEKKVKGY